MGLKGFAILSYSNSSGILGTHDLSSTVDKVTCFYVFYIPLFVPDMS